MDETREFLILRYSLIQEAQPPVFSTDLPIPKGAAVLISINDETEFKLRGAQYSFVGFIAIQPNVHNSFSPEQFWVGKTAKLKPTLRGQKVPGDIVESKEDNWIPLLTIFDVVNQYIFVEKDWRFGKPDQIIKIIEKGLRVKVSAQYGYSLSVEYVLDKSSFWHIIDESSQIYKLCLKLLSPNIFDTNKVARDTLEDIKKLYGNKELEVILSDEAGNLTVPKKSLDKYISYISEGEGSWKVLSKLGKGQKKIWHRSYENFKSVDLPIDTLVIDDEKNVDGKDSDKSGSAGRKYLKTVLAAFSVIMKRRKNINEL